ncbi:MAG: acetyl-CoA carboxylase biotin carboxylase subunit [Bacteroidales bacterium]|nr:acetyl-CoA carboxylase biotin carboxylase subunit [Bacteroidales bacterium]
MKIKKVLIANRGEIAVRVMRTCKEMGIKTVAVYSDVDRTSMHVRYADEAVHIGPSPSNESYLVKSKIIEAAKRTGADAIHPGYGFLSENAEFAKMVRQAGIIFIGPSSHAISMMGDKIIARQTAIKCGVPVVPGTTDPVSNEQEVMRIAKEIGFPVIIKASAGGGGKGMRLVEDESQLANMLRMAKSEAMAAFGDDSVYVEKYITSPHHIEFQVLADQHGNVIHLCERECSIQRRHQKMVEETPSPIMTPELREEMGEAAVRLAKAVDYEGAGTVEFLVDENLNYYFLEMNTRLQVEHPVTEFVIGLDLVKEQIRIAAGEPLRFNQSDITQKGHSIECRISAEDPDNNFMPDPGLILHITEPTGFGVRTDSYVYKGFEIPIYYDPMIAKLIVWGTTRNDAIHRMIRALDEYKISGIKTTIPFLEKIMTAPDFVKGKYDTHFIQKNADYLKEREKVNPTTEDIAAIAAFYHHFLRVNKIQNIYIIEKTHDYWKNYGRRKNVIRI